MQLLMMLTSIQGNEYDKAIITKDFNTASKIVAKRFRTSNLTIARCGKQRNTLT